MTQASTASTTSPTAALKTAARGGVSGRILPPTTLIGFVIAIVAVVLIGAVSFRSLQGATAASDSVTHTLELTEHLQRVLSRIKDAETGQRGFLLTGNDSYLAPYNDAQAALPAELKSLKSLVSGDAQQQRRFDMLEQLTGEKMEELDQTISMRRSGDAAGALSVVASNRGKTAMDLIRSVIGEMQVQERNVLNEHQKEWQEAARFSIQFTWGSSVLLLILIVAAASITSRDFMAREAQAWIRAGQMGLSAKIQGEQRLDVFGNNVLEFLAAYLGAQVGAIYIAEGGRFRRFGAYAVPNGSDNDELRPGDGLLGQVAKVNQTLHVKDVPDGYLHVASATGRAKPRELVLAPASIDGVVQAVLELGFFRHVTQTDRELLDRVSETLGVAVRSSKDRSRLEELLEETQRQAEELQAQQEELRVSNEELEEQGSALKQSQAQLEAQQAELEQTNSQLEEQMQLLEDQRDHLTRAQDSLTEKASELERSNQYKSEFLANMSHELRTPLNSTLILAGLLADNKSGNLSDQQVKFAQTIFSAGNDLLALINDILDLSKIESGKVDVSPEQVLIARSVDTMQKAFDPVAQQKKLKFTVSVEPGTPDYFETDAQRLGQILKNLLSNALKFTDKGEVAMKVYKASDTTLSFAIRDTGIGISESQRDIIFEAFRQADGSTHRKYGGTGLGLSISRDLARLLGGDIVVHSTPGDGSVFTLTLPIVYAGRVDMPPKMASIETPTLAPIPVTMERAPLAPAPSASGAAKLKPPDVDDDRDHLQADTRLILAIEDDVRFSTILRDLVHEMGFQFIATHSANEGLSAAMSYRPSAILLDMNLPDYSGLGVLDQLKHNPKTRHIPVHVLSVADYTQEALERGAIGYALKPVKREQLVEAIEKLQERFSQSLRRVLVVEDDERQRDSIGQLLANGDVQIVGVATAGEALTQLQKTTFDCMVIDLNLPDLSGYEFLKKIAEQDEIAFPPVIVYTGRSLTRDEEQQLRRFSKSIIIKDARSPERLLDEVTLFIHQVESKLPVERQRMLKEVRDRDATLEGRRILVVEDDVRNVFALTSVLEPKGAKVEIARNGLEALDALKRSHGQPSKTIDLVLMDIMMPEMDGITAMMEIRKNPAWKKLPIIALTAKAMKDDQEKCLAAGANDYIAKPLDVEKLLSLVRVWMPK
jgi:CheY-like chemotaxis protein/CHASE3 domain sensor protein